MAGALKSNSDTISNAPREFGGQVSLASRGIAQSERPSTFDLRDEIPKRANHFVEPLHHGPESCTQLGPGGVERSEIGLSAGGGGSRHLGIEPRDPSRQSSLGKSADFVGKDLRFTGSDSIEGGTGDVGWVCLGTSALVVVVDEADALAQSRAAEQMHHEDRAGVDALLAGVDSLAGENLPVIVVMCTNREGALDPAVLRRAAGIFQFDRPGDDERRAVLIAALNGVGIDDRTLGKLVNLTGPRGSEPGFTYSDLTQKLLPTAIMAAFPDKQLGADVLLAVATKMRATPEFRSQSS
jgi:ATPase family associated with various cellular activities (AAA)